MDISANLIRLTINTLFKKIEREREPESNRDVHTEHCCATHGCKYGDGKCCPVEGGWKKQSYPCERCEDHVITMKAIARSSRRAFEKWYREHYVYDESRPVDVAYKTMAWLAWKAAINWRG